MEVGQCEGHGSTGRGMWGVWRQKGRGAGNGRHVVMEERRVLGGS